MSAAPRLERLPRPTTGTHPDYKHSYDEDTCDDEGNNIGKLTVYCVDGKLCHDWDRGPDGDVEPIWFLIINTDDPASCRVCTGELKPGYAPPASARVKMSYTVGKTILAYMDSGIESWDHDNENACQENPDASENCSLCLTKDWLDSILKPALADRPVKPRRRKKGGRAS
jgi:hypothetical protein